jgi:hypothetical protein
MGPWSRRCRWKWCSPRPVATAILQVRLVRAKKLNITEFGDEPIPPDGARRAYIIDSIRHPSEVDLLRNVYQSAFVLVGIVCEEDKRLQRLNKKYSDAGEAAARAFMERDAKDSAKYGQRVSDAFHLADIFLDNSTDRFEDGKENGNRSRGDSGRQASSQVRG